MWSSSRQSSTEFNAKEIAALIEASNVTEQEIRKWQEDFLAHYPSGLIDKKTFIDYYKKLYGNNQTDASLENIFDMIDRNKDGTIDFNELLIIIVVTNHLNDIRSRIAFVFDMWDVSGDGHIDKTELANVITAIYDLSGITDRKGDRDPTKRAKEIISKFDVTGNKKLNKEEFISCCKNDPVIRHLLLPHL